MNSEPDAMATKGPKNTREKRAPTKRGKELLTQRLRTQKIKAKQGRKLRDFAQRCAEHAEKDKLRRMGEWPHRGNDHESNTGIKGDKKLGKEFLTHRGAKGRG
jgi:hypothetical protein